MEIVEAIDTLRAAMLALSKLNQAVWEEVGAICTNHQSVLVQKHDPSSQHRAGMHRVEKTGGSATRPKTGALLVESSINIKELALELSELEPEGKTTTGCSPFQLLIRRRKARVAKKKELERELGVLEENEKEKSMCGILAEVRARLGEIPEHMRWALNEVYLGSWHGKRWYLPNTSCYTRFIDKQGWHMPEKAINIVVWRLHRCMRLLYTIHFTFKEGFRDLTRCLPEPGRSGPCPEANPTEHLAKFQLIVRDLAARSKCSFSQKVRLTAVGVRLTALGARADGSRRIEELLSLFPDKDWTAPGPPPVRWCTSCPNTHELFLFPDTPAGYLAQMRWFSFHFLIEDLVETFEKLHLSLDVMSQLLPGAPLLGSIKDERPKAIV
ncbi:hypothetical protein COCSUDRAFT_62387 [Coccomyxa subellipsoidea C-169]|uniref:Uncharacterized protein n=1 Tax=Coccomyxa subellipsoidea (strain C-169) TaxID=574566 RepID=I0YZN7_COCSC|nr:hypothetical protein COCSUDRAFT_62387 [Coccomyxa subellipsoidea C-169]EIE23856.1 hypothetical protein COCSUDRAFT_62387 [Coccomyxa subellipsoidea C-169]|eukprot:XP_005648400.1 hypothetical protein COCSUDRAFT_62387 [Coccomyxa subellipsoidea C-169]